MRFPAWRIAFVDFHDLGNLLPIVHRKAREEMNVGTYEIIVCFDSEGRSFQKFVSWLPIVTLRVKKIRIPKWDSSRCVYSLGTYRVKRRR